MLKKIIFLILTFLLVEVNGKEIIEIDYTWANIILAKYDKVPHNERIFHKDYINHLRSAGIKVYVDYFTPAKKYFYENNNEYEISTNIVRSVSKYRKLLIDNKKIRLNFYINLECIRFLIQWDQYWQDLQ